MRLLIPSSRLRWVPESLRLSHEYCFFLHDEFVRMLVEYEIADADKVSFNFSDKSQAKRFEKLAKTHDTLAAMRELGLHSQAMRVVMNVTTMAMVSDCAHHIYEALRCLEKRKVVVALNLLRKPLLDGMTYLSWFLADEDGFYSVFTSGDPSRLTPKMIGNKRKEIFTGALSKTELVGTVAADALICDLFDVKNDHGLYPLLQHAVHLVTVERIEIRTTPENFNFIFKNPSDDDVYEELYSILPTALLYLSHVILSLFERIKPMDAEGKQAFVFRSINAYRYLCYEGGDEILAEAMHEVLSSRFACSACGTPLKVTRYNALRLLLTDSFRCTACKCRQPFPLSWIF